MLQLNNFYAKCLYDEQIKPTHISVYMALLQLYILNSYINPIHIYRKEVMHFSKINSIATYHKCMKHLHQKGYIKYKPSYNPYKSSMVIIKQLKTEN